MALALLVAATAVAGAGAPGADESTARVGDAVVRAVVERMGPGASVSIERLRLVRPPVLDGRALVAVPHPGARTDRLIPFTLKVVDPAGRLVRAGEVEAMLRVRAPRARALRAIARGAVIAADAVVVAVEEAGASALRAPVTDVVGGRALRAVAAGEALTAGAVAMPPPVRAGDEVTLWVRGPGLEVSARGVATQSGALGADVQIVTSGTGRTLRGRVVARGEVEVRHGS